MESSNKLTLVIAPENFTYYSNSRVFYYTGKNLQNIIKDNQIVLSKGVFCQFKFDNKLENLCHEKLFTASRITFEVDACAEECYVKLSKASRFNVTQILSYEDNIGKVTAQ